MLTAHRPRPVPPRSFGGTMSDVPGVAVNPGALTGSIYVPDDLRRGAPLVVILHGCTQQGLAYAEAAGWFALADRHRFVVLIPQQVRANNANLCFNWFEPGDTTRGEGEVASIKAMIDGAITDHGIDPARVFVTGLSAGAAMAGAMLATYPEMFAGGGLIAGLPYGTANSVQAALQQMRTGPVATEGVLAGRVRNASAQTGSWPRVSVWHGGADRTVSVRNGEASVAQWLAIHGLEDAKPEVGATGSHRHQRWRDEHGVIRVEYHEIAAMGHGTPIDTRSAGAVGHGAPFVLDVGTASSVALLDFWGLAEQPGQRAVQAGDPAPQKPVKPTVLRPQPMAPPADTGVAKIINDALRSAGLLK